MRRFFCELLETIKAEGLLFILFLAACFTHNMDKGSYVYVGLIAVIVIRFLFLSIKRYWDKTAFFLSLFSFLYVLFSSFSPQFEFVDAFRLKGYEKCSLPDFEEGYRKIALYITPGTTKCTHAARQLSSGLWTSKLGEAYDIQHDTPQSIEGSIYGCVYCYMKKTFK